MTERRTDFINTLSAIAEIRRGYRLVSTLPLLLALGACGDAETPADDDDETASALTAAEVCEGRRQVLGTPLADNWLTASPAGDCVFGLAGNDTIQGGPGRDILLGGKGGDVINGGAGDDVLVGGLGSDTMNGGRGNDLYLFYPEDDQAMTHDTINDINGQDTIQCSGGLRTSSSEVINGTTFVLHFPKGLSVMIPNGARFTFKDCGETPGATPPPPPPAVKTRPYTNGKTLVAPDGKRLCGAMWSLDINAPDHMPTPSDLQRIKGLNCNTLHVYGETFSGHSPADVGYRHDQIDKLVSMTKDAGLLLVLTVGNGGENGYHKYDFTMAFWDYYAPRYSEQAHVIYELQNEPYGGDCASPNGINGPSQPFKNSVTQMERDGYQKLRTLAPNTPVLLWSVMSFYDARNNVLKCQDQIAGVDWTKTAIAFHGYAGTSNTKNAIDQLQMAAPGIPVICTEFDAPGASNHLNTDEQQLFDSRGISWLSFTELNQLDASHGYINGF